MRRHGESAPPNAPGAPARVHSDWATLGRLLPYLWQYKWRVIAAIVFMVGAKLANVGVPLLLKQLVDTMNLPPGDATALLVVPVGLLLAYGALRLSTSLFTELRELVFAKATQGAARSIALQTFQHLHALSLRFHLERQTGGMTRDIERGVRGIESLISFSLFNVFATLIEVTFVLAVLGAKFDMWYVWMTLGALVLYIGFTVWITENSMNDIRVEMPRVPRSMSRVMPPVWRSRWKRRLSACRWRNTCSEIERAAPSVALANTSSRNSVNSAVDNRSKP